MMGKSQHRVMQRKQKPGVLSAKTLLCRSAQFTGIVQPRGGPDEGALRQQLEAIFASIPEGIVACDQDGKILQINATALQLFGAPSEAQWRGRDCQEFLERFSLCDEQQQLFFRPWLSNTGNAAEGVSSSSEHTLILQVPGGRKSVVNLCVSPLLDNQKHITGRVLVFHELSQQDQQALHLQRVHEAVLSLTQAMTRLPEHFPEQDAAALPEGSLLLSPPVIFIAQQLVDVIRRVLNCHRVSLKALGPTGHLHYLAGSGFSAEQDEPERATDGLLTLSGAFEERQVARLIAQKEVVVRGDHLPPGLGFLAGEKLLVVPLCLEQQLVGMLCILKVGVDSVYTSEEIALVKALATQALLVLECFHQVHEQTESQTKARMLHEVNRLSHDFLLLASHELRTPLTGILGNLQLAQRRLEALERQVATQAGHVGTHLAQAQQPLSSAGAAARLQQRMINAIIDDARLQANQLELHLQRCDLLALLTAVVVRQQQEAPGRTIVVETSPTTPEVAILADAERITQVFAIYLTNALAYSPADTPVTVHVAVEDGTARVSIHNDGPGIPLEEQKRLWERSYRAKGCAVQHELDLSVGLSLYLCRAFIELHAGRVGVESTPGQGATFWFTLPMEP